MIKTLGTYEAATLLASDENANWTRAGAFALVEYLEELEDSTGESIEFDAVAIRCDFAQYSGLIDWAGEYFADEGQRNEALGIDADEAAEMDEDELKEKIREYIQDNGTIVEFDGGVIVSSF